MRLKALEAKEHKLVERLLLEAELGRSYRVALYATVSPKEIPIADLVEIIRNVPEDDPVEAQYRKRISSPLTAIRAFCVSCQGGDVAAVRNCSSANCPLWAMRMGNNPFWNKLPDAEGESQDADLVAAEAAQQQEGVSNG